MKIRILGFAVVVLASILVSPFAKAITKDEMDRARAITAQWYLRWANNGSGYLDDVDPKSMSDLESKLKEKEKQNLKAFKDVPVPGDYASWDKEKAVEYWSVTFFNASGLNEQGKGARSRVKKKLSAMNFSDPSESKATEEKKTEVAEEVAELPSAAPEDENPVDAEAAARQVMEDAATIDSTLAETVAPAPEKSEKSSSGLWLYIVALIVLVGVVVWLVVFASKTMQGSNKDEDKREKPHNDDAPVRRRDVSREQNEPTHSSRSENEDAYSLSAGSSKDEKSLRDKFARTLTLKEEEIRGLHREINTMRDECMRLGEENARLTSDLSLARRELDVLRGRTAPREVEERREPTSSTLSGREQLRKTSETSEIYLGRVNSKGLFVRADRKPVEGKSVFVLSTTDNYTGTYRVLQSSKILDLAFDNPEYYLAGGCVAADITNTSEADGIRTINAGTAIFEDGCWRVLRKAKIAYE